MILRKVKNNNLDMLNEVVLSYNSIFLEFYNLYDQRQNKESFKQNGDFAFLKIIEMLEKSNYKDLEKKDRNKVEISIIKEIRKLTSSKDSENIIDLKLIHAISNSMFEYLSNKEEISIDKTLYIACHFMDNIFSSRNKKSQEIIQKGKINFNYVVSSYNRLKDTLNQPQIAFFKNSSDIKKDIIYESDLVTIYFPSSYSNFMSVLRDSGYDEGSIHWCTKGRETWYSYNSGQRLCILVKKKIENDKDPNRLISLKISTDRDPNKIKILYYETCDANNEHMSKEIFLKDKIFTKDVKSDENNNIIPSESFEEVERTIASNLDNRPSLFDDIKEKDTFKDIKTYKRALSTLVSYGQWDTLLEVLNYSYTIGSRQQEISDKYYENRSLSSNVTFKVLVNLYEKTKDKKIIELFISLMNQNYLNHNYDLNIVKSNHTPQKIKFKDNLFYFEMLNMVQNTENKNNFNFLKDLTDYVVFLLKNKNVNLTLMNSAVYLLCNKKREFNTSIFNEENLFKIITNILDNNSIPAVFRALSSIYSNVDLFKSFLNYFKLEKDGEKLYQLKSIKKAIDDPTINIYNLGYEAFKFKKEIKKEVELDNLYEILRTGVYKNPFGLILLYHKIKNIDTSTHQELKNSNLFKSAEMQFSILLNDFDSENNVLFDVLNKYNSHKNFISLETFKNILSKERASNDFLFVFKIISRFKTNIFEKIIEEDKAKKSIMDFFSDKEKVLFCKFITVSGKKDYEHSPYVYQCYIDIVKNTDFSLFSEETITTILECCLHLITVIKKDKDIFSILNLETMFKCINASESATLQFANQIRNLLLTRLIYKFDIEHIEQLNYREVKLNSKIITQKFIDYLKHITNSNYELLYFVYYILQRYFDPEDMIQDTAIKNENIKVGVISSWMLRYESSNNNILTYFDEISSDNQTIMIDSLLNTLDFKNISRQNLNKILSTFKSFVNDDCPNNVKSYVVNIIVRLLKSETDLEGLRILNTNTNVYIMITAILAASLRSSPKTISVSQFNEVLKFEILLKQIFGKNSDLEQKLDFLEKMKFDISKGDLFMTRLQEVLLEEYTNNQNSIHKDFHENFDKTIEEKKIKSNMSLRRKIILKRDNI